MEHRKATSQRKNRHIDANIGINKKATLLECGLGALHGCIVAMILCDNANT
ncbi:hypothetical protein PPEP_b0035 [Pseudoalteromonas peptidolytica F12-50-A1]|uniref:Uncharacterized protein n=1 Tax=Pseudoalteromonas peptidolytica F12-50-A1 TaxID=1315280 RepID=A0A8I0MYD6_9GAMM|nr:hypothetical protein [Pseudoalteromonas peptidolytica F12-50-A1]